MDFGVGRKSKELVFAMKGRQCLVGSTEIQTSSNPKPLNAGHVFEEQPDVMGAEALWHQALEFSFSCIGKFKKAEIEAGRRREREREEPTPGLSQTCNTLAWERSPARTTAG